MNLQEHLEVYVSDYRSRIETLDRAISEEMRRNYNERRRHLLRFLHSEKKAYAAALSGLNGLAQNLNKPERENTFPALDLEQLIDHNQTKKGRRGDFPVDRRIYRFITWGGAGDVFVITPMLRALKQRHPDRKIYVYCIHPSHAAVLGGNPNIDRLIMLSGIKGIYCYLCRLLRPKYIQQLDYGKLSPGLFYKKKAAEIIGEMVGIEIDDPRPEGFLTENEESDGRQIVSKYSNPVVIHVTGKCSPNKNWTVENWEQLISNNPTYSFLQLGQANEELIKGAVDLRGTSFRRAFAILKAAKAFIGIESVFAHAAAAFRTPAIVLFGATTPVVWGHDNNQNLYHALHCSPCLDILSGDPCPYGKLCMSRITVSDVERELSSLMKRSAEGRK